MDINNVIPWVQITAKLADTLNAINYNELPISDYNKQYIKRLMPAMSYYMDIYIITLFNSIRERNCPLTDITLVDYGGGCGFFSMFAKAVGIGKVIYIDLNPQSAETIKQIKEITTLGPDVILTGDSPKLLDWCQKNETKPEILIAIDVIEHIYDLRHFFSDLTAINKDLNMLFTTGSNPLNPLKRRRLYKEMDAYEKGDVITPNYYTKRLEYITRTFPKLTEEKSREFASLTRGMIYDDIKYFINAYDVKGADPLTTPSLQNRHNTCDPETGNYMERILPIAFYAHYLRPSGHKLGIHLGFYAITRKSRLMGKLALLVNRFILSSPFWGIRISPFIIIQGFKEGSEE